MADVIAQRWRLIVRDCMEGFSEEEITVFRRIFFDGALTVVRAVFEPDTTEECARVIDDLAEEALQIEADEQGAFSGAADLKG